MAASWQRHVATHPILWFLIAYVCVIATVIGWRLVEGSTFLTWEFWEKSPDGKISGPEGIRNLVWSLATLVGGAAAGIGLLLAGKRTKAANHQAEAALKQSETAFQSLVTERFTKAVEQLGHEKRAVRLGAIYALERIARDSPRDRDTIVETLAAYIRELAPWRPPSDEERAQAEENIENECMMRPRYLKEALEGIPRLAIDIEAALNVICRLLPHGDAMRKNVDLRQTDLTRLDAPSINLSEMNLIEVNLYGAVLMDANLYQAQLQRAVLDWASLLNADLSWARLTSASLDEANLHWTNLSGADLSGTDDLTQEQINGIRYHPDNPPQNLPAGLTLPKPYDP